MKTRILSLLLITAGLFFSLPVSAKGVKDTATFTVSGNCDMCKTRIETGAKKGGATKASWSTETHLIQISFDPEKTSVDKIQQSIANAGYDTEKFPASTEAYQKLPHCCQYDRKE